MCDTCGCEDTNEIKITKHGSAGHSHTHEHSGTTHTHSHTHPHTHGNSNGRIIELQSDILNKNNLMAERNRGYFEAKNIFAINLVSSPGSGKTSLLERSIKDLHNEVNFFVIEGDQQTMNDADRIKSAGAPVIQINTGSGCHLDSDMINKAVRELNPEADSVVMIENVGNLVCPALFDLGETKRVVIISVTEGDDKPVKYPNMFATSHLCVINKTDLMPYVDFDIEKTKQYALQVNHHLEFIELSVKTGEGMNKWYEWIKASSKKKG